MGIALYLQGKPPICNAAHGMPPRPLKILAMAALALAAAGCPKPPPPPPQPDATPAPPPPPPKCEALSEKCAATADTRAKITNSSLIFTPAPGWIYAQQSSATLAQSGDAGPALAFLGIEVDAKDAKKEVATKDAALAELVKQLGLSPLKRKVSWKKPDDKKSIGPFKVDFWQLEEGGVRGAKKGPLLVVAIPISDGKGAIGVGFVPDDDKTAADAAILKSIESLGKAP
jgi:hypothetical protein